MAQIIVLVILIMLNAFFASVEIAFISLNDAKIDMQAKKGDKKAKKIKAMLENPSKFLATIQIGITLAGFLSSAFASETFASELAPILNKLIPAIGISAWNSISIILITIILSYFTLVFGELVPKRIGMKNCEKIAFASIGIIRFIALIATPFVKILTLSTNLVSKLFGVTENEEETVTEEEIRMMVDVGEEKGTIDEKEKKMINNVFEFNDKVVSEIMIPRTDIYALDMNLSISNVIEQLTENFHYSRMPVYDETIDEIKGIVYIKDILLSTKNKNAKIKNLMKEAYFVPESIPIDELFKDMQTNKQQLAIVIDEYGGTSGLVTMEDILEELVGNIFDEYDHEELEYKQIDENTYLVEGNMPLYELKRLLATNFKDGDYDTISGYIIDKLGKIPAQGEKILVEDNKFIYNIEEVEDNKIKWVKIVKKL